MYRASSHHGEISFDGSVVTIVKREGRTYAIPIGMVGDVAIERIGFGVRAMRLSIAGAYVGIPGSTTHRKIGMHPLALTFRSRQLQQFQALQAEILAALAATTGRANYRAGSR